MRAWQRERRMQRGAAAESFEFLPTILSHELMTIDKRSGALNEALRRLRLRPSTRRTRRSPAACPYAPFAATGKLVPRLVSSRIVLHRDRKARWRTTSRSAEDTSRGKPC